MATKHEVLQANLKEWLACREDKDKRGEMIKRLSTSLSMHKKSIGRSMKRLQLKDRSVPDKRGRSVYYGKDVDAALFKIWEEVEYLCAENMHGVIGDYVTLNYKTPFHLVYQPTTNNHSFVCALSFSKKVNVSNN